MIDTDLWKLSETTPAKQAVQFWKPSLLSATAVIYEIFPCHGCLMRIIANLQGLHAGRYHIFYLRFYRIFLSWSWEPLQCDWPSNRIWCSGHAVGDPRPCCSDQRIHRATKQTHKSRETSVTLSFHIPTLQSPRSLYRAFVISESHLSVT